MTISSRFFGDIHYLEPTQRGGGRPKAIFVHGAGGYAEAWANIIDRFEAVDAIAIDMPGHGKSGGKLPDSPDEQAEIVESLRLGLDLGPVYIVGHSLGGAVAQCYARDHGGTCRGIVVSNSGAIFNASRSDEERARQRQRILEDWPAAVEHYALGQVSPDAPEAAKAAARRSVEARVPEVMHHDVGVVHRIDHRPWVGSLDVPCLVLAGYEDRLTPFDMSLEVYRLIPRAQLSVVSPGGHSPFLEYPLRYIAAIESFIAETEAAR